MTYLPVLSKADFVRRFVAGEFGNKGPNWHTLEDFLTSGYTGLVHIRSRLSAGKGKYNVPTANVAQETSNFSPGSYYLAGMAPHHCNLIQGEIQSVALPRAKSGYYLRYSCAPDVAMRDAFAMGISEANGIIAVSLLQQYLCPNSMEWLYTLLRRYHGHVVEFSCFSRNWGTLPNFNTVFWEVRNY